MIVENMNLSIGDRVAYQYARVVVMDLVNDGPHGRLRGAVHIPQFGTPRK